LSFLLRVGTRRSLLEETEMRKTLSALAAAAAIALVTVAVPGDAGARDRGGAVAAGVLGGLAAGAIIGGAVASPYGYGYYGPAPVYVAPGPYYVEPSCRMVRERFWDGYAWRSRRVEVC
jgi:hypothetical protein